MLNVPYPVRLERVEKPGGLGGLRGFTGLFVFAGSKSGHIKAVPTDPATQARMVYRKPE